MHCLHQWCCGPHLVLHKLPPGRHHLLLSEGPHCNSSRRSQLRSLSSGSPPASHTPQQQLRSIVLPADPPVIMNARPQDYVTKSTDRRVTSGQDTVNFKTGIAVPGGNTRITEDDQTRVTQQTGFANGSLNTLPGTDPNAPGDNDPGLPYGNTEVPDTGPI